MLVLTRKLMEKLYIGGDICVTIVRLEGGQVRLGIDAPKHVPVVRAELLPKADRTTLPPPSSVTHEVRPEMRTAYSPKQAVPPPLESRHSSIKTQSTWVRGTGSQHREPSR
ncbi:MAG: carbon storage regulator [Isosphaeraceae bacterium]